MKEDWATRKTFDKFFLDKQLGVVTLEPVERDNLIDTLVTIKSHAQDLEGQLGTGLNDKAKLIIRMCDDIAYRKGVTDEVEEKVNV